ncbi:MAG: ECF transporter S component, partial [Anaerolineae bacterium]
MTLKRRRVGRAATWVAVLSSFVILLVLANRFTDGEQFYGVAPAGVIAVALFGLLALYRGTAETDLWAVPRRHIAVMTAGAALYAFLSYVFNELRPISIGPVTLQPQICVPVLLGYAFTPVVGFFAGAVGSLMGDFLTGWGVFPAWHIGTGLIGLIPGLVRLVSYERRNLRYLSTLVVVLLGLTAGAVLVHPQAPEPWTGEVRNFSFWGWMLILGGVVMVANSVLLEQISVALAAVNLWGTLGIIAGNAFAALAHIWIYEYGLGTAVMGEFAPSVGTDILNLMIFTPLVLAAYRWLR